MLVGRGAPVGQGESSGGGDGAQDGLWRLSSVDHGWHSRGLDTDELEAAGLDKDVGNGFAVARQSSWRV